MKYFKTTCGQLKFISKWIQPQKLMICKKNDATFLHPSWTIWKFYKIHFLKPHDFFHTGLKSLISVTAKSQNCIYWPPQVVLIILFGWKHSQNNKEQFLICQLIQIVLLMLLHNYFAIIYKFKNILFHLK